MNSGFFEMKIIQEQHVFLGRSWHQKNVCDPFTRLYYIKNGGGYLTYKGKVTKLNAGNVYIVPAGTEFEYKYDEGEFLEKIFFHISVMTFENYDMLSKTNGIYKLTFAEAGCEEIFDVFENQDYTGMLKVKMILYKTVAAFIDKYNFEVMPLNKYSELVKNIMKYVRENTKITLSIEEISKEFFVSQSKLRNAFKKETGMTLGKYIDDMVFYKAKSYLGSKIMSMGEISSALGFCDQFYFSRRFKEKYGKTPSEYRRELSI